MTLTDIGRLFYERAQRAVAELDEAMLEAGQSTVIPRGKVRVTCALSFGVLHLCHAVSAFLERYPDVVVEMDLSDRFVDIAEEGFDLGIRIGALEESSLIARKLTSTQLVVCGAPQYLAKHPLDGASPYELRKHNCLVYSYNPQPRLWTFKKDGEEIAVAIEGRVRANNGDFLRQLALHGRGLALLPTFIVGDDIKAGRLIRVLREYDAGELGIHAVYTNRKFLPAKVRLLLDFLAEYFSTHAPWTLEPVLAQRESKPPRRRNTRAAQQTIERPASSKARR